MIFLNIFKRIFLVLGMVVLFTYPVIAAADATFVNRPDVQQFISKMVKQYGFNRRQLNELFSSVKIKPRIIQSVKVPLEVAPWYIYQNVFITPSHIHEGVEFWNRNAETLARAEKIYGVPASIIVATIGVETKYGKEKGAYRVLDALTNIAFSNSHRAGYFRQELVDFLLLSREQHLDPTTIRGSYAGAIGQPQFMPSSYRHFAVNFSGNSRIDLNNNELDIIGSIANYYQKHGWLTNQPVAIPTTTERSRYRFLLHNKPSDWLSQEELEEFGLFPVYKIPAGQKIRIIELQGTRGNEYWIGLTNFEVIKRYNPSNLYAMAVYQLSYYIDSLREKMNHDS
ncbi:MAG: lytic murein transglycosylase B [Pseudomonadota bacterium]